MGKNCLLDTSDSVTLLHRKTCKNEFREGMTPEEASDVFSSRITEVLREVIREEVKKLASKTTTQQV